MIEKVISRSIKDGTFPATDHVAGLGGVSTFQVLRRNAGGSQEVTNDCVAEETPVALLYNGRPHVVMLATPLNLTDFAIGFSITEGIVKHYSEIEGIEVNSQSSGVEVHIKIPSRRAFAIQNRKRNLAGRSGCGLCGTAMLEDAIRQPARVDGNMAIGVASIQAAVDGLHALQPLNAETGAIHAAAWVEIDGHIHTVREDVGRHNALDKLIGALIVNSSFKPDLGFVLVTSRASYEMVMKTAITGISIMLAISAPTALAIRLADSAGLTLIGFARASGWVVYTHPHRIQEESLQNEG